MRPAELFRWGGIFALAAVMAAVFAPRPAAAQAVSSTKVLPSDVYLYFSIPSVAELKSRFEKTSFSKIVKDPAFGEFVGQLEEYYEKASREFEKETQLKLKDLLDLPTGEVSFAVMKPPRGQVAAVAFLDFGKSEDLVDQLLSKLEDALDKENVARKVQEFKNTRIVVYTFPGAAEEKGPIKPEFSYFIKDTQFVVSNEVSALESVLTNWGGEADRSFANNRIFKHIMEKCKPGDAEPLFQWFLNPIEALKAGVTVAAEGNPQAMMVMGFLPLLGLNDFRGMGGAGDWATGGYEGISKTMMYVDQPPQGLLNLFRFPATDLAPPQWVGAKTQAYAGMNWDVEAAYEAVETLVDTFQGAGALDRIIDDLAEREGGPGFHLKKDVLDQLSGRFYMVNQGVESLEQAVPKLMFSVGVRNTKTMQDFVAKIIKTQGVPAKTRNFRGETIVEFDAGQATVGLCVFNNSILISSDISQLEAVVRGDRAQQALADSPEYRMVTKSYPQKTSILSFQQSDDQVKILFEAARKGELGNADIPVEAKDLLSKLPPFEAIQKYLPLSGSYAVPDENGVIFVNTSQMKK
jgi:hypothetical protein